MTKYFIVGGAGFMGSHLVKWICQENIEATIIVYDNFSSGKMQYLEEIRQNKNVEIIHADVKDRPRLNKAMRGIDIVYHFASNPDISQATTQPDIDFWEGTYLTNNILEAMRVNKVKKLVYASGSGIYGDTGTLKINENHSHLLPISTYGASKLACEALICAYCYMFDMDAVSFRFANVVGPSQTHGVGYDFIRRLKKNPGELRILGNGRQSKSYLYIADAIKAMRLIEKKGFKGFTYYNVATNDYITVREIADIAVKIRGLKKVKRLYTGGSRGWKGDVPIVRLNTDKIRRLGWRNTYTSKEAIYKSIKEMYEEIRG